MIRTTKLTVEKKTYLLGAGGHAEVLLDMMLLLGLYPEGIIDKMYPLSRAWHGVQVVGDDDLFQERVSPDDALLANGLGANPDCRPRNEIYVRYKKNGYSFCTLAHPSAVVSQRSKLCEGSAVMAGAVVQSGALIGENTVVNTRASIDHGCHIECGAFISPGATVCGDVLVGEGAFIGAGSVVLPGVRVGKYAVVGAGAVATMDVPEGRTVVGVPARMLLDVPAHSGE